MHRDKKSAGIVECLVGEDGADEFGVVDLARAGVNRLEKLVDFFIAHLLAQIRQDCKRNVSRYPLIFYMVRSQGLPTVTQLADSNETRQVLVKDLETTAVFLRLARVAETTGTVEDFGEGFEVD